MDIIVIDWTRMGRQYCLAGAVVQEKQLRIVRPLPARGRDNPVPNQGWSAYLMDGHHRWDVFEMVRPNSAPAQPPHLEDVWVADLKPRRVTATAEQRRALLESTRAAPGKPLFGAQLTHCSSGTCYLEPNQGQRSLTSVVLPADQLEFKASWRDGVAEPDYRVHLPLPGGPNAILAVKDHFLLARAEKHSDHLEERLRFLNVAVRAMGAEVAVRLGLSRPFPLSRQQGPRCYLMADGFFSPSEPQP